jgi:hypothetical protein
MNNKQELITAVRFSLNKKLEDVFEGILDRIKIYYEQSCGSISELKKRTTKNKGDVFEQFCVMYLKARYPWWEVWLLSETPKEVLDHLSLKTFDTGIDIVVRAMRGRNTEYYAVQAKYRKQHSNPKYNVLSWKNLSTFYSTCARTGPPSDDKKEVDRQGSWDRLIVMTTAKYCRRMGRKTEKDWTFCLNTFKKTKRYVWDNMIGSKGNMLGSREDEKEDSDEPELESDGSDVNSESESEEEVKVKKVIRRKKVDKVEKSEKAEKEVVKPKMKKEDPKNEDTKRPTLEEMREIRNKKFSRV